MCFALLLLCRSTSLYLPVSFILGALQGRGREVGDLGRWPKKLPKETALIKAHTHTHTRSRLSKAARTHLVNAIDNEERQARGYEMRECQSSAASAYPPRALLRLGKVLRGLEGGGGGEDTDGGQ